MSLLDALLLDPHRINVWIAYRTDGPKSSVTQSDPWDGSTDYAFQVDDQERGTPPRGNVLRMVDGEADPSAIAFRLQSCKDAQVEDNVVVVLLATPLRQYNCQNTRHFNNRTSSGLLLCGVEEDVAGNPLKTLSELTTAVEDGVLLAMS